MRKTPAPPTVQLPPLRVEPRLRQRLVARAKREGRTLSSVIRSLLRDHV